MNIFQHFLKTKTVKSRDDESFSSKNISLRSSYMVALHQLDFPVTINNSLTIEWHGNTAVKVDNLWKYCSIHLQSCTRLSSGTTLTFFSDCRFFPREKWAKRRQAVKLRLRSHARLNWIRRKISEYITIKSWTVLGWLCCLHQEEESIPTCHRIWPLLDNWVTIWEKTFGRRASERIRPRPQRTSLLKHY